MRIEHSIAIDAPPKVVWSMTVDIERWPDWTPTITAVHRVDLGPFGMGSVARIKQPMQPQAEWVVTAFEDGHKFVWESRRKGMHFIGTHEISPHGAGAKSLLRLEANGIVALMLWPVLKLATRHALATENQGLKKKAEEVAGSYSG